LMLWTAPPRHESAIEVGAVRTPTIQRSQGMQRTTTVGLDIAKSVFQDDQLSKCCWRQDKWGTNSARRRITFEWTRLALTSSFSLLTTAVGVAFGAVIPKKALGSYPELNSLKLGT